MEISTKNLDYDTETYTFTVEASTLGIEPGERPPSSITVVSHRTGARKLFVEIKDESINDSGWLFVNDDFSLVIWDD